MFKTDTVQHLATAFDANSDIFSLEMEIEVMLNSFRTFLNLRRWNYDRIVIKMLNIFIEMTDQCALPFNTSCHKFWERNRPPYAETQNRSRVNQQQQQAWKKKLAEKSEAENTQQ